MNTINYKTSITSLGVYKNQLGFADDTFDVSEEFPAKNTHATPTNMNQAFSFEYVNGENNQNEDQNYSYTILVESPYKGSEYTYEGEQQLEKELVEQYEQAESNWTVQYEQPKTTQADSADSKTIEYTYQNRTSVSYSWSSTESDNLNVSYERQIV